MHDGRSTRPAIPGGIIAGRVVAIGRRIELRTVGPIIDGLLDGGVQAFELTLNDPEADALASIEAAAGHANGSSMTIGAGTVLTIDAARRALEAGASFLVMPHTDVELIAWAASNGTPAFPGAATPTEAFIGWRSGAAAVKLFPASVLGPAFLREFRGPFPDIPLIPTGGVTADSAGDYIRAGAIAVGVGSWLIGDGEVRGIAERADRVVRAVAEAHETTQP
jgi:2-dehydro-3-deoxyphosphogluconate aldolase/(4S)-4-hydroxy-2-oxoglutarate aldolase